jgi:hypothetical protein
MYGRLGRGRILNLLGVQLYYIAESVSLGVHASLRCLHNVNCLFLSFLLIKSESNWALIKGDWLAACIALRVVGAVYVVVFRRWCKICTILQPMGSKGRYLKKCPKPWWQQ